MKISGAKPNRITTIIKAILAFMPYLKYHKSDFYSDSGPFQFL